MCVCTSYPETGSSCSRKFPENKQHTQLMIGLLRRAHRICENGRGVEGLLRGRVCVCVGGGGVRPRARDKKGGFGNTQCAIWHMG